MRTLNRSGSVRRITTDSQSTLHTIVRDNVRRRWRARPRQSPTYGAAVTPDGAVGARVKSLREAMDLSLRDLAERSGVSAPMLSQVERGDTSPTLAVAEKIAAGLDLTLSQLLRLDEDRHVVVVRAGQRPQPPHGAATRSRS